MWRLITFIILLIASVWIGLEVFRHPGYLLIAYQPWMVQMPIWFALLGTVIALILFYLLITSFDRLEFLCFRMKNWLRIHREHKSYSTTQHGLTTLIEGRWQKSERLLISGVKQSLEPLINYLGAAKAAHEQRAYERRDEYIKKAYTTLPKADLAIGLTQAELELSQDQLEHAVAMLNHLRQKSPRHPRVLKLLEKAYVRLGDWENLKTLLPSLRKAKLITTEEQALFEKNIYCEIFKAADNKSLHELQQMWENTPRSVKKNADVVCAYVLQLQRFGCNKEMEALIRKTLKNHYQATLVHIYGTLPFENLNRQLVIVGAWLKLHGQKPALLLLLGKLCVRAQLWGKAKDYFEKCLALGPNADASLEYGKLLEQLGDSEAALQTYRVGLSLIT